MRKLIYIVKEIFARLWALWGIISFIVTFLIIFLPSMCSHLFTNQVKGQAFFIYVSRIWMRVWLTIIGCPVIVHGKENFKKGENYVITFNHNALLDVPLSAPFVEGANKTIAKKSFAKAPIFGFFYSRGSVLVDRKSERSRVQSFESMKQVLREGMHMCIYPEGTRNRGFEPIKDFHLGAFKLATEMQKSILPCVIIGTREATPINKTFYLLPTILRMYFLPAVTASGKTSKELMAEVHKVMTTKYIEKRRRQG